MKLMHLSDLHLGKRVNEFSMMEDQHYILGEILNIIDDEKQMNDVLIGASNISIPVINNSKVLKESEAIINSIEYIDNSDVKVEIEI